MDEQVVIGFGREVVLLTLMVASPVLVTGLIVGLIVSILQSVTQIQEMTLTFVPKIVAVMIAFVISLPWIISLMVDFAQRVFGDFMQFFG